MLPRRVSVSEAYLIKYNAIMKKYHSVLFMLAMIMAACVFVSCSDDDEENGGGSSDSNITIVYGNKTHEYGNRYFSLYGFATCEVDDEEIDFYFKPTDDIMKTYHLVFPYSEYGDDFELSDLSVGFSDFEDNIYLYNLNNGYTGGSLGRAYEKCDYVSGTAEVIRNDGEYVTIRYNDFTYTVTWDPTDLDSTVKLVMDGTLTYEVNNIRD